MLTKRAKRLAIGALIVCGAVLAVAIAVYVGAVVGLLLAFSTL